MTGHQPTVQIPRHIARSESQQRPRRTVPNNSFSNIGTMSEMTVYSVQEQPRRSVGDNVWLVENTIAHFTGQSMTIPIFVQRP